ncbi:DMT family transporter [Aestuariivirga litoralis]|uniref:DMT family transporter n=1 Tax=Aestuariivirga litoralis TaxID=2650924 RepID=UPI0018C78987|nr:DMT family transporter [Aestuariivirga litoralis]MBG1231539.1 DMT family transporter [Aestuariivirga litoralis]
MTLPTENKTRGILWMLATMLCFITLDTTVKYTLAFYPLMEVNWGRFFFATVIAVIIAGRRLPQLLKTALPQWQALRSLLLAITTGVFNAAIMGVPLPTGTVIMFLTPIIVTMMSSLLLREHVGWRRWLSIGAGFLGALVVTAGSEWSGTTSLFSIGLLLIAAFTNASYQTVTRRLRTDDPLTTLIYSAALGAVFTSILLPFSSWVWPTPAGWGLLMLAGLAGCLGHLCLIKAFTAAPASVVAPFAYSSLIWATIYGFLIWGDLPNVTTLVGAALIIGSGLYIFLRERQLGQQREPHVTLE